MVEMEEAQPEFNSSKLGTLAAQYNDEKSDFRKMVDEQALALPMCIHLSRESLKNFLLSTTKKENVESAQDSILAKWTKVAQKAKHWLKDESTHFFPKMI